MSFFFLSHEEHGLRVIIGIKSQAVIGRERTQEGFSRHQPVNITVADDARTVTGFGSYNQGHLATHDDDNLVAGFYSPGSQSDHAVLSGEKRTTLAAAHGTRNISLHLDVSCWAESRRGRQVSREDALQGRQACAVARVGIGFGMV